MYSKSKLKCLKTKKLKIKARNWSREALEDIITFNRGIRRNLTDLILFFLKPKKLDILQVRKSTNEVYVDEATTNYCRNVMIKTAFSFIKKN